MAIQITERPRPTQPCPAIHEAADESWVSELHLAPPICPRRFFGNRPLLLTTVIGSVLGLAFLAAFNHGAALDTIDAPISAWIVEHRTPGATAFFQAVSRFGDNIVVFSAALVVAALTWRRCRYLALAFIGAALFRPGLEFVLKGVISRERPDLGFGIFHGPSHPSGHPMAAISFFGLVPAAVALFSQNRRLWTITTALALSIPPLVAAARVYKGAHWATDVVASLLWGSLYLLTVQGAFNRLHPTSRCEKVAADA